MSRKPGPVDSFETLSFPFTYGTWIWIVIGMAAIVFAFTVLYLWKLRSTLNGK